MKFSIRFADQIVGAFIILALAILIVVILMLGINQRWFERDPQYKTYFNSVTGLSKNMAVQYKGFTIGNVKNFRLTQEDTVEVIFSIYKEESHRVTEGSVVELRASPIGLGNTFHFYPGNGKEQLEEGAVIPEYNSGQAADFIRRGLTDIPESTDSINIIIGNVQKITDDLQDIIGQFKEIKIESNLEQLTEILGNLEKISGQAASPSGTVMSILDGDGSFYNDFTSAISSLAGILEELEKTSEFIPSQLPQVAVLLNDLNVTIRQAQNVMTALENNPLLKRGIPQHTETSPGGTGSRDLEF
jgi:phospholipid/cholesterol/gamma-HCH transport system substrate-binding protein